MSFQFLKGNNGNECMRGSFTVFMVLWVTLFFLLTGPVQVTAEEKANPCNPCTKKDPGNPCTKLEGSGTENTDTKVPADEGSGTEKEKENPCNPCTKKNP